MTRAQPDEGCGAKAAERRAKPEELVTDAIGELEEAAEELNAVLTLLETENANVR